MIDHHPAAIHAALTVVAESRRRTLSSGHVPGSVASAGFNDDRGFERGRRGANEGCEPRGDTIRAGVCRGPTPPGRAHRPGRQKLILAD